MPVGEGWTPVGLLPALLVQPQACVSCLQPGALRELWAGLFSEGSGPTPSGFSAGGNGLWAGGRWPLAWLSWGSGCRAGPGTSLWVLGPITPKWDAAAHSGRAPGALPWQERPLPGAVCRPHLGSPAVGVAPLATRSRQWAAQGTLGVCPQGPGGRASSGEGRQVPGALAAGGGSCCLCPDGLAEQLARLLGVARGPWARLGVLAALPLCLGHGGSPGSTLRTGPRGVGLLSLSSRSPSTAPVGRGAQAPAEQMGGAQMAPPRNCPAQ